MIYPPSQSIFCVVGTSWLADSISSYLLEVLKLQRRQILIVDGTESSTQEYTKKVSVGLTSSIIGSDKPQTRSESLKNLKGRTFKFIHPRSVVSASSKIDEGSIVMPGAIVSPDARIGKHVLIGHNATIGHNVTIGDLSVISSNVSIGESSSIGNGVFIGSGSQIDRLIVIGEWSSVQIGSVVLKEIRPKNFATGCPAKTYSADEWAKKLKGE